MLATWLPSSVGQRSERSQIMNSLTDLAALRATHAATLKLLADVSEYLMRLPACRPRARCAARSMSTYAILKVLP